MSEIVKLLFDKYKDIMVAPDAFESICVEPLPTTFWINPKRTTKEKVLAFAEERNIDVQALKWNNEAYRVKSKVSMTTSFLYALGHIHIQEEVSMLPGTIANSLEPQKVLDICAAPGNKTAQIGIRQLSNSLLIANEPHLGRHSALRANLNRLGVFHTLFTKYDGASFPRLKNKVDLIVADVPCSCEGTIRKSKNLNLNKKFVEKLVQTQKAICSRAVENLEVGGHLLYSTCTFNPDENEGVIQTLINRFGESLKIKPIQVEEFETSPGITQWGREKFDPRISNTLRVWPQQNNSGGFFIALLEKVDE